MKAPDKIYIQMSSAIPGIGFVGPAWDNSRNNKGLSEYINKNALLDYSHQRIEELNSPLNGVFGSTEREHCNERISELLLLVDKLNEM